MAGAEAEAVVAEEKTGTLERAVYEALKKVDGEEGRAVREARRRRDVDDIGEVIEKRESQL